ncbi:unnamed protein product [Cuscuta campestris]|uniref:CCHC-type domain-containing protein n=1 Tax=Cuscuta campestris TaxID=132261 RepID=A0A484NMU2_9ASTE|nr:unnamed protein product [Cuscuta campestris]
MAETRRCLFAVNLLVFALPFFLCVGLVVIRVTLLYNGCVRINPLLDTFLLGGIFVFILGVASCAAFMATVRGRCARGGCVCYVVVIFVLCFFVLSTIQYGFDITSARYYFPAPPYGGGSDDHPRLDHFSPELRGGVSRPEDWDRIIACLAPSIGCDRLNQTNNYTSSQQLLSAHLPPLQLVSELSSTNKGRSSFNINGACTRSRTWATYGWRTPRREQHLDDVEVITDLQRQNEVMRQQIAELTQRLAVRDLEDHEESDRGSRSSFEKLYHYEPRGRDFRIRDDYRGGLGFKVEIPSFLGTLQADDFIDRLNEVDRIFEYKDVPDRDKVKLVAIKLHGRASAWWEQMRQTREKKGKPKINDWEKMKGLRQSLQDVLSLHSLWTVSKAYKRALEVEKQQNRKPVTNNRLARPQEPRPTTQGVQGTQGASSSTIKCYRCGEPGHRANECKKPALQRSKSLIVEENIVVDDDEVEESGDPIYDDYVEDDVLYGDGDEDSDLPVENPSGVLDLAPIPRVGRSHPRAEEMTENLRSKHDQVRRKIEESNNKYKARVDKHRRQVLSDVGDFVWAVLTKDRFPVSEYDKLKDQKIGPCEIVQKINDNAYRLRLPSHLKTSDVFNVKHLTPCFLDSKEDDVNSRTSSFPTRGD